MSDKERIAREAELLVLRYGEWMSGNDDAPGPRKAKEVVQKILSLTGGTEPDADRMSVQDFAEMVVRDMSYTAPEFMVEKLVTRLEDWLDATPTEEPSPTEDDDRRLMHQTVMDAADIPYLSDAGVEKIMAKLNATEDDALADRLTFLLAMEGEDLRDAEATVQMILADPEITRLRQRKTPDGRGFADQLRDRWTAQGVDPGTAKHMAIEAGAMARSFYIGPTEGVGS